MNTIKCIRCRNEEHIYPIYVYNGNSYCKDCLVNEMFNSQEKSDMPFQREDLKQSKTDGQCSKASPDTFSTNKVIELIEKDIEVQREMGMKHPKFKQSADWRIIGMQLLKDFIYELKQENKSKVYNREYKKDDEVYNKEDRIQDEYETNKR